MKFRSIRGPNWVEARVKVTRMMENTTPTTVMIAAAMVVRICRAASALPLITQPGSPNSPRYAARSAASVPMNKPDRRHDLKGRHEPQAGTQHLAPPVRR